MRPWMVVLLLASTLLPVRAGAERIRDRENPIQAYRRFYITPRAFPDSVLYPALRDSALRWILDQPKVNYGTSAVGGPPVWKSAGPTNVGGRVTAIAIDPTERMRWFLATVGGIWRSTDAGGSWRRVSDPPDPADPAAIKIGVFSAVVVVPGSGAVIVAGGDPNRFTTDRRGGPGLWRSSAHGDPGSWRLEPTPAELQGAVVFRLRAAAAADEVYAATSAGLFWRHHSATGAIVWERTVPEFQSPCTDVVIDDRASPPRLVVGSHTGLYRAAGVWIRESGVWTNRSPSFGNLVAGPIALALSPSNHDILYARVSQRGPSKWNARMLGVFRSNDGGVTWTNRTPQTPMDAQLDARASACGVEDNVPLWSADGDDPPYAGYNSVIEVDPAEPDLVYCGSKQLLRSDDGGNNWCVLLRSAEPGFRDDAADNASWDMRNAFAHDDVHAIAFDATSGRRVLVGDDGGLHGLEGDFVPGSPGLAQFFWTNLAHGLDITEFYRLTTQPGKAPVLAGGTQDNGGLITFGNRTWYRGYPCDVGDLAVDAEGGGTFYGYCNLDGDDRPYALAVYPSLVPGSAARNTVLPTTMDVFSPISASRENRHHALAQVRNANPGPKLYFTVNGKDWNPEPHGDLPAGTELTAVARTRVAAGEGFYAAYADDPLSGGSVHSAVLSFPNPTGTPTTNTLPNFRPNAIAVDPRDPARAVIAMNGSQGAGNIVFTKDFGTTWHVFTIRSPATGVAWDPLDPTIIYVATDVGVLRGVITNSPVALALFQFNEGLPGPLSVNDIVASDTGVLTIGTMGYGAWQFDLGPEAIHQDVALCVRDDVYDRGAPFVFGAKDPEHPVEDPVDNDFYVAGSDVEFWNSTDIRVDTPALAEPKNRVDKVDHVAFESTPTELADGFPGTIVDRLPTPGSDARIFVQVTNLGTRPAHDVRVFAMWRDAYVGNPELPADFWSTTLPPPGSPCGPMAPTSAWHTFSNDPAMSPSPNVECVMLPEVRPEMPEVATFYWHVPPSGSNHYCVMAIAENPEDVIDASARSRTDTGWLIRNVRQIAQRNLVLVDNLQAQAWHLETLFLPDLRQPDDEFALRFVRAGLPSNFTFSVVLPKGTHKRLHGVHEAPFTLGKKGLFERRALHLDYSTQFVADSLSGSIEGIELDKKAPRKMLVAYRSSEPLRAGTRRFTIASERDGAVLGGATWMFRSSDRRKATPVPPKGKGKGAGKGRGKG